MAIRDLKKFYKHFIPAAIFHLYSLPWLLAISLDKMRLFGQRVGNFQFSLQLYRLIAMHLK